MTDTTAINSLMPALVVLDPHQRPRLWRVTAWLAASPGSPVARKLLEAGEPAFLATEATARVAAWASTDPALADDLDRLLWTVEPWHPHTEG